MRLDMKEKSGTIVNMKEAALIRYLEENGFDKRYPKLVKKLDGKKIIIYGTGLLFQCIKDAYDLSALNIIGISDMKYTAEDEGNVEFSYRVIPKSKIPDYNPDVVLIATQRYFSIMENFMLQDFKGTKVLFIPFVGNSFWKQLLEIWR